MQFIDLQTQYQKYKSEIDRSIHEVLDSGHYILGKPNRDLEEALADFVGVKHAIAVSSGTDSLLIALMALGIGKGDEVITTPFSWISTAEVIHLVGAKPVFVDIDPKTYNIDLEKLESAITNKTKAIMPVSLFGQMPDFNKINKIADSYHLPVIEDAAQSFGATQKGKKSCSVSTIGSTSFFPAKPLGCYGDGGALFTDDDELAEKIKAIRVHGGVKRHYHPYIGINGRLDTIQAAVLLVKLKYYPEEMEKRALIGEKYSNLLKDFCQVPFIEPNNTHVFAQYTIRVKNRDAFQAHLKEKGIPTAIYYPKLMSEQPCLSYLGYQKGDFPEAEKACNEVVSIPMHPFLTDENIHFIAEAIKEATMGAIHEV